MDWAHLVGRDAEDAAMTAAEKIEQETRAKTLGDMLGMMLSKRFGELSEDVKSRLRNATPEQMEAWALAVLDAESIDDVFAAG